MIKLWARPEGREGFPKQVARGAAERLNTDGWGIYQTVNSFSGRRLRANVTALHYWLCEIDGQTKVEQERKLRNSPLRPTLVIESKRGFHCYWKAVDASLENWTRIERGIVKAIGGDPKAIDPLRLLRAPGYLHWKDREDPFLVKEVWRSNAVYTEEQMLRAFPVAAKKPSAAIKREVLEPGSFWARVSSIHGREAIERLNGHWLQSGEVFELEEQANGNYNLVRDDGARLGCFIRGSDGSFGNAAFGPSVAGWLKWYGWSWGDIARGLRELWPELDNEEHKG